MNFNYTPLNPAVSYPTQRLPVFGQNVVSTSTPLSTSAGLRMLQAGGNAVDAIIAAAACITLTEPVSNGLGSDAFAIVWDGKSLQGLNASGRAPQAWTPDYFKRKYGADSVAPPKRGIDSVTVPGAVAAWMALHQRYGKLPFADLMQPAIEAAERGYGVPVVVQQKWAAAWDELHAQPGFEAFFGLRGRAPQIGERVVLKDAAKTLRLLAASKGEAFYRGEVAEAICRFSAANGGAHTAADFAAYQPEWVQTIRQAYRGYELHEIPPNGQGITALIALGLLQHFDVASLHPDSAEAAHLQIEAIKLAFADVYRYVAEPGSMTVTAEQMLDPAYLAERAKLINPNRAQVQAAGEPGGPHRRGGTIYMTAADASGMMVSFIQSNYMGFGSGCVVPGYGVSLQNRGHGFSLDAASPNVVAPGKRPFHTIIPAFLMKDGQPQMSFGVMGANMQPQGHVQTLSRMVNHGQSPQAACDAPRWRFNAGLEINVEQQMDKATVEKLVALGHQTEVITDNYQDFGSGQFIWRLGDPATDGYVAASDSRRDGQAGVC